MLGGCGLLPGGGPAVHLDNLTSGPVAVHVKGVWVGTYASGSSVDVPLGGHGNPPYQVAVLSPNGVMIASVDITADDVKVAADNNGSMSVGADLVCGSIRLSFGRVTETLPRVDFAALPPCD